MLAGVLAATALGCGGDDDAAVATTTSAPEIATEEVPNDVGSDEMSGDVEAWCLGWNSDTPLSEPQTPEELQAEHESSLARLEALLDVAPDEIAEASASLLDAQRVLGEHFADHGWDLDNTPRLDPALADDPTRVAVGELEAFAADNC